MYKLSKQQRLDWYVYMYLLILSNPSYRWESLWKTEEEGTLTGFPITSYVGITNLPELPKGISLSLKTLELAIIKCEQPKQ